MSEHIEEPFAGQDLADPDAPLATSGAVAPAVHPHGPASGDPVHAELEQHVDPAVAALVHEVRDRFGARGLRDAITLASYELDVAERAAAALAPGAEEDDAGSPDGAAWDGARPA
jgi:hypothetical protein